MQQLIINATSYTYELSFNYQVIIGTDISTNMLNDIKTLIVNKIPESIFILRGPGSFTSTRVSIIVAKTLSIAWRIPIKSCTIMDCIPNIRLILSTGTQALFVHENKTHKLLKKEQIDFAQPFTSNIKELENYPSFIPWPNLTQLISNTANLDPDPQPFYSILPSYLKSETEINNPVSF